MYKYYKSVIKTIFLFLIVMLNKESKAQGIIIADDKKQQEVFSTYDSIKIRQLAVEISKDYSEVILHLGRSFVFDSGNIFDSDSSKQNLLFFCEQLKKDNVKVFLWFFDSYGSASFNELYDDHQDIINQNLQVLDSLKIPYDGIAIDMEWINVGGGSNNKKYIEILKYLRSKVIDKKIFSFASLVNNETTNSERGYDTKRVLKYADNIIDMLYIQDADFFIFSDKNKPELNVRRIEELRKYFKKQGWLVAVSLEPGMLMENENGDGFQMIPDLHDGFKPLLNDAKFESKSRNSLAHIYEYKFKSKKSYLLKNNETISFHKKQRIFYFELYPKKVASSKDFIWEYFMMKERMAED